MSQSVTTRFAPSPSGLMHMGNARTAVINWLFASRAGGEFLLRFDDTDQARSDSSFTDAAERDLTWLGLDWGATYRQSDRTTVHAAAIDQLKAKDRLYPCYETADELAAKRTELARAGRPPVYDRAALSLTAGDRQALEGQGLRPHWRLRLDDGALAWDDLIRGPSRFDTAALGDPVLVREDGQPLYILASVADDIDLAVSHVIRGEDHVANTPIQIALLRALDAPIPAFGHHSLVVDDEGQRFSKRTGALSLASLRESGLEPEAVFAWLARVGTSDSIEPSLDRAALAATLDLARFSRSPIRYDRSALDHANRLVLASLPFAKVEERLIGLGVGGSEAFWLAVRENLSCLADARLWWGVVSDAVEPVVDGARDADYLMIAADLLPEFLDDHTWKEWTRAVAERTERKGRALYHPLRLALTGREDGPELRLLLSFLDPQRARRRLRGETA